MVWNKKQKNFELREKRAIYFCITRKYVESE